MKFICTKENIMYALSQVSGLASKHVNLPILANVLIEAGESGVTFVTTNLEVAIRVPVRAKVEQVGNFTVPAKTLSEYVQLLTHDQVEVERVENELVVRSSNSSTKIKGTSGEDFPVVPSIVEQHGYTLKAEALRQALLATIIAAAKNDIRPELAGVYAGFFTDRWAGLMVAATDSYRLAEQKVAIDQGKDSVEVIIPARTILEMSRILGAKGGMNEVLAHLWVGDNQVALRFNGVEMTSRVVEGKYPDYAQIIPASFKTTALVPADLLANKIKSAALFTTLGVNAVSFDLHAHNQSLGVSSMSTQTGEHSSTIDCTVEGDENSILLNHRYVLEGLGQMDGEVQFQVNGGDTPCLFRSKDQSNYIYIVMPIRQ